MTQLTDSAREDTDNWDKYWSGVGGIGAFSDGGVSHPAITAYWQHFFRTLSTSPANGSLQVIDIAGGNGALIETAGQIYDDDQLAITSLDLSPAAIHQLTKRFPHVNGLVADANAIPLQDNSTDLVMSQFGIEYAGIDAIDEAIRVVNPGGNIALMMHCENGVIFHESKTNLTVIKRILDSHILPLSKSFFAARAELHGGGDRQRQSFQAQAQQFCVALGVLEHCMSEFGTGAAGGFVHKLYNDLANVHEAFGQYVLSEVQNWLSNVEVELEAYKGRMQAMLNAAMAEDEFDEVTEKFRSSEFTLTVADKLYSPESSHPLAWVVATGG
ncbi:class I SAM-dependent methyltransferase [Alteromonas sp. ZYF713]|nr:class I SAM-dependent methyltransferase [Alteromonas sp. ZYF713]